MSENIYDIAIIGGGPVGIFTAYYAKLRGLNVCLIESLPNLGGQPQTLYAQKKIYDVAGFLGITGENIIKKLVDQLNTFNCDILTNTTVDEIDTSTEIKLLKGSNFTISAKSIIIAVGNGAFNPRQLAIEYNHQLDNDKVDYFVNDINKYKNKNVLVAGGGDSAVDWATAINEIADSTKIIHRRDTFRALGASVQKLDDSNVEKLTPFLLSNIEETNNKLNVTLKKVRDSDTTKIVSADYLLVNYGYTSDSKLLKSWGLELQGPYIKVNQKMETNLPGVYAIGDAIDYDGKLKLIASGFGEGPVAVAQAQKLIYPEKSYYEHSTTLFDNN